jgi:uncharacterized protein
VPDAVRAIGSWSVGDLPRTGKDGMAEQPWYQEGLRFTCTACGNCCTGGPGFVWVNKQERLALAEALGFESEEAFHRRYVRQIGVRFSLKERANFDCVLFDGETRKCTVYAARPRQCRSWPFWHSNLASPADWQHTCRVCPGAGQGRCHPLERIETQRQLIRI